MTARLVVIAGPSKDSLFPLTERDTAIGREPGNQIAIIDLSLSRRHCIITRADDGSYGIKDLNSRNGTFVNGLQVKEGPLHHGDQIAIGDCVFVFHQDAAENHAAAHGQVEFEDALTVATEQIRPQDVIYLHPDRVATELQKAPAAARHLNALLKISRAVHSIRDLEELQGTILDLLFEVAPAERGAILLDRNGEEFRSTVARHRQPLKDAPVRVSRTISRQVFETGAGILGSDVLHSEDFKKVESVVASQIRSMICVPIPVFDKIIGCIYVDTTAGAHFNRDHLELLTALASICATALDNARRVQWLEQENLRLTRELDAEYNLIGESPRMKQVYELLSRVAPTDSTVLIGGESGTGKEVAARVIHRNSPRSAKPFAAISCAAIPEGLVESELFGHERGAFTGAVGLKRGRLEAASGGTVFLDEIGELSAAVQVKLLRVLQEHQFERVGGNRPISVDIRVIAASNKDLALAVDRGSFRKDLFYRVNVFSVTMPALRERSEDIPALAEHFVRKHSRDCKVKPKPISREAMAHLIGYDWPGNVRELENAIERALVMSVSDEIRSEDLPEAVLESAQEGKIDEGRFHANLRATKKQLIVDALQRSNGNYTEAARILGLHPNYLHRLIKHLGLKQTLQSSSAIRRR